MLGICCEPGRPVSSLYGFHVVVGQREKYRKKIQEVLACYGETLISVLEGKKNEDGVGILTELT